MYQPPAAEVPAPPEPQSPEEAAILQRVFEENLRLREQLGQLPAEAA
jgi:hypothetical protein